MPSEDSVRGASLSYTSLLSGCGFSGTETALLEMAKYLVDKGHSVQIYGVGKTCIDHGIHFISGNDFNHVDLDVDWYSPLFFHSDQLFHALDSNRTKVFIWFQCFLCDSYITRYKNKFRVYGQYLCNYVANEYPQLIDTTNSWVIYNGLSSIFTTETIPNSSIKKGKWIYHPVYERGGSVVREIFSKVNSQNPSIANQLHLLSYYTPDISKHSSSTTSINHGSKTKLEVRDLLLESDYFIYPLVLPDGRVHHDTFGSVMLEALACGTIVVVWDVACISSVYSDYVIKIPVPEHIKQHYNYNPQARFASCHWMLSDEAQQLFITAIHELESDQAKKEEIRARGVEWARTITWDVLGATMETQLLTH